ncbi:MAG: hypothetical protein KKB20_04335 [Proteobacteria bacterium]|nr:hypothetical protein [Pseudomonadota bacterium]
MDHLDGLETRIEQLISEISDIIQRLRGDIHDPAKVVSFGQIKEIENSIMRMKRQGLPIPAELNELKLKLFSEHERQKKLVVLYQKIQQSIGELMDQVKHQMQVGTRRGYPNTVYPAPRKPRNSDKSFGKKGYNNVEDYLIPVIKLMWSGLNHRDAFRKISQKLDVRYNTVSSQCTRSLDLTTAEFIKQVNSKRIVSVLERKYPDQYSKIIAELKE